MKIFIKGITPEGHDLQIEDWSENYTCPPSSTIAAFATTRHGEKIRISCDFENNNDAMAAFGRLIIGENALIDFNFFAIRNGEKVPFQEL